MGSRVVDNAPHLRHYSADGHESVLFSDTIIIVFDLVGIVQSVVSQNKVHFSVSERPLEGEGMELEQTRAVFLGGPLSLSGGMLFALRGSHVRERRRRHRLGGTTGQWRRQTPQARLGCLHLAWLWPWLVSPD